MSAVENPGAGQGAVVLDIGGDVGALVVWMPAAMAGVEVAVVPAGRRPHPHDHRAPGESPDVPLHVAVVARPVGGRVVHTLVFGELRQGAYQLYVLPDGPVRLTASVRGGQVTEVSWPAGAEALTGSADDLSRGTPGRR